MNRNTENNGGRANKTGNYAQAARTQTRPPNDLVQEQTVDPLTRNAASSSFHSMPHQAYAQKNSYKAKDSTYKKAPVQLPMAPPSEPAIQFGSINQPLNTPLPSTARTGDIPVLRTSEVQFGSLPVTDTSSTHRTAQIRLQPKPDIPRTTNDARLFTQPYAPRRDLNQGEYNRYYNNYNKNNNNNYNNRPPQQQQPQQQHQSQQHQQHSPHQQPQTLPPSPMSHRASPNMNNYQKKNLSPHIPHSSPQNIQMTASWSPNPYYYPQYPVSVSPYGVVPTNRSPITQPAPRKVIAIIDPTTGAALNTSPMSLTSAPSMHKEEKVDFKVPVPHVSKAVVIVDPAIRDRELREKREREEAEQEAIKKAEEEKKEAERKELERIENERLAEIERLRLEVEEEARKVEEEARKAEEEARKAEEEREVKRVLAELEEKKKAEEQDRILAAEVAAQNIGRVPSPTIKSSITIIQDPSTIQYPPGIQAPPPKEGKLTYSIEFLLQFQQLCLDTEEDLSAIASEMGDPTRTNVRQTSDRGRGRGGSNMGGDPMFRMGSRDGRMEMGKFNMGRPLTPRVGNNSHMERQGSRGGGNMNVRGGRGGSSGMKVTRNPPQGQGAPTIPFEQVVPLEKSENRWIPAILSTAPLTPGTASENDIMTQEFIIRKVNALLNKLTLEKFDSIAPQIFEYAKQSEKEEDGRSLRTVMKLTFEKACDEPAFASMWAQLGRHMYDSMTDEIRDTSILNEAKEPSSGVLLFRKYLFNRCQVEFEKGWKVNMPEVDEVDGMMTEEYYIAAKAKRQGLGLIQFIGELFKLEMLSERIMYSCMIKLCNDPVNAGDEEAESLCKLLTTIGKSLDGKAKTTKWVDVVIGRMKNEMINSPKLTSRVKFMIQDLLDLRKDRWVPRSGGTQVGPTTIAKIHEMAEKAKEEKEAANMKRNNSNRGYIPNNQYNNNNNNSNNNMARTGSYRGRDPHHFQSHNNHNGGDGWSTVSPGVAGKPKAGNDLSNFGKTERSRTGKTNILGPGNSPFPSLSRGKPTVNADKSGEGRSSSATNMFSALEKTDERKKLSLAPKSEVAVEVAVEVTEKLSDDAVKRKAKNILEEYFNIRDKKELSECVKELDDAHYRVLFVGEMLTVVEKKAEDVAKTVDMIVYLQSENLIEKDTYVKAFKNFMEGYDDLTIDVPQAPKYVAQLLLASHLTPEIVDDEGFDSLQKAFDKLEADSK